MVPAHPRRNKGRIAALTVGGGGRNATNPWWAGPTADDEDHDGWRPGRPAAAYRIGPAGDLPGALLRPGVRLRARPRLVPRLRGPVPGARRHQRLVTGHRRRQDAAAPARALDDLAGGGVDHQPLRPTPRLAPVRGDHRPVRQHGDGGGRPARVHLHRAGVRGGVRGDAGGPSRAADAGPPQSRVPAAQAAHADRLLRHRGVLAGRRVPADHRPGGCAGRWRWRSSTWPPGSAGRCRGWAGRGRAGGTSPVSTWPSGTSSSSWSHWARRSWWAGCRTARGRSTRPVPPRSRWRW